MCVICVGFGFRKICWVDDRKWFVLDWDVWFCIVWRKVWFICCLGLFWYCVMLVLDFDSDWLCLGVCNWWSWRSGCCWLWSLVDMCCCVWWFCFWLLVVVLVILWIFCWVVCLYLYYWGCFCWWVLCWFVFGCVWFDVLCCDWMGMWLDWVDVVYVVCWWWLLFLFLV